MPSGHVRKRGKSSWAIIVELGRDPVTGRRVRQHWETVRGTKRDAEDRLRDILSDIKKGTVIEPHRGTLCEYLERWLGDYARHRLAPRTYHSYESIVRKRLIPALGQVPLQRLQPVHIQALISDMLSDGGRLDGERGPVSGRTALNTYRVLHRALEVAVRWQLVARNVCDAVEPPKPARFRPAIPDAVGVRRLLDTAEGHWIYPALYLAIHTGLRQGELLALRWVDVDLDRGVLSVSRALHRLPGQGLVIREPKTARGRRTVAIAPSAVAMLRRLKRQQAEERLAHGPDYQDHGLVICRPDGRPVDHSDLVRAFRPIARRAGLEGLRWHDLRHAHATLLLAQGVHPKVVQERLGHATIGVTMDTYSHVLPGLQEAAATVLDDLLSGRQPGLK